MFVLVLVALALAVTMLILLTKHYEVSNEKLSGSGKDSALGSVTTLPPTTEGTVILCLT